MTEKYKYASLIAKLMREKITDEESAELDEWICRKEENMKLFECLINDYKVKWAKQWFAEAGVSTKGIKWRKTQGWYKSEQKALRDFYLVMAGVLLFLIAVYFVLEI